MEPENGPFGRRFFFFFSSLSFTTTQWFSDVFRFHVNLPGPMFRFAEAAPRETSLKSPVEDDATQYDHTERADPLTRDKHGRRLDV